MTIAKSLYLTQKHKLTWQDETLSDLEAHEVLLETLYGAVSLGTELPQYKATERSDEPLTFPRMTGYESFARVVAIGDAVTKFKVDDRVVAFYGHRSHAILHEDRPIPAPKDIAPEMALSVILTCDVTKGIRKVSPTSEDKVLIAGCGAIGLFTLVMLQGHGVTNIGVVEPDAGRRELAISLGAKQAYAPDETVSDDYTIGFECSSYQIAFAILQNNLVKNGKICVLADGNIEPLILLPAFHRKELSIVASSDGWDYYEHAKWFFEHIAKSDLSLAPLYDMHVKHRQLPSTFLKLALGKRAPIKILVDYSVNL